MSTKQRLFQTSVMAVIMPLCISFLMAVINVGFIDRFVFVWMRGWGCGFLVAWPLSFFLPLPIQKLMKVLNIN